MKPVITLDALLGPHGSDVCAAMRAAQRFLDTREPAQLLPRVGWTISEVPSATPIDKSALQDSYGGSQSGLCDDFLAGRGLFYVTEQRRLFLDGTSGHYQMLWGYQHPDLAAAIQDAVQTGVAWDNHSNIPQAPLKWLAHRLVALANAPGASDPLDTVLLGVCTGSVACAAALKIQLKVFARDRDAHATPVVVVLEGNYHGSDMVPQFLRGMWPELSRPVDVVTLPPNNSDALEQVFRQHGPRIAGFWAEPVMMNREAIALEAGYLQLAQRQCRNVGALFCVDEIQTGFWNPDIFDYRALGLQPDLVVLGKGMTAGFHPLSGVLFRTRHDVLAQYDAISTNGSAALPAVVALASLELIARHADGIRATAVRIQEGFSALAAEFPERIREARGRGHLAGLKFHDVTAAQQFHRRLLEAGLWTRVHAYHAGHSTLLSKLGLLADAAVVDFMLDRFRGELRRMRESGAA